MKKETNKVIPPVSDGLEVHKKVVLTYLNNIINHITTNLIVAKNTVSSDDVRYIFYFNVGWVGYDVEVFNNGEPCDVVAYTFFGECILDFKIPVEPKMSGELWEIARRVYNNDYHWVNEHKNDTV